MTDRKHHTQAVVDWVEIKISLAKCSKGNALHDWAIKNLGVNAYFCPQDIGAGKAASIFILKIQEPVSWNGIAAVLDQIEKAYPFSSPPALTGIEVSMDTYIEGASRDDLAALTAHRYRSMHNPVSKNHRFAGRKDTKGGVKAIDAKTLIPMLGAGRVINIGEFGGKFRKKQADPVTMRFYAKTTDGNGETNLPVDQWRSRWEITLRGGAMPFSTIAEARGFKFEKLSKYFHTRIEKKDLSGFDKRIRAAMVNPGAKRDKPIKRRVNSSKTVADIAANSEAYQALRKLTRQMNPKQRGGYRVARNERASDRERINSVTLNPHNPHEIEKKGSRTNNYLYTNL